MVAFSLFAVPFPNFPLLSDVQRSKPAAWDLFQLIAGDLEVVREQTRLPMGCCLICFRFVRIFEWTLDRLRLGSCLGNMYDWSRLYCLQY